MGDHHKGLVEGDLSKQVVSQTMVCSIIISVIGAIPLCYTYHGYVITMVSAVLSGKWYVQNTQFKRGRATKGSKMLQKTYRLKVVM